MATVSTFEHWLRRMPNTRLTNPFTAQDAIERAAHGLPVQPDVRAHLEHPSNQDPSEPLVILLLHELSPLLFTPKPWTY